MPVLKLEISCSFKVVFNFFATVSHVPLFLVLLIGKLFFHISKINLVCFCWYLWKMQMKMMKAMCCREIGLA